MCTPNKAGLALLLAAAGAWAQPAFEAPRSVKIQFPADSPLTLVAADWGQSPPTARGGALVLDLHSALSLRNVSQRRIRGVTLEVLAQELTPGGRGSVTVPCLDVVPGENFPVRVDLRLLRPLSAGAGPLVTISLDGVLFDDLSFYGPNRLNLRRSMTAWEIEAQRDRRHFQTVLATAGPEGVRREMLATMARQADRPRLDVRVARAGRATVYEPERELQFAFLRFPDAPVEPVAGLARVAGGEARAPRLEVVNRSSRPIRHLEVGWLLRDRSGREFLAGSVPAALALGPGQKSEVLEQTTSLRFGDRPGQRLVIEAMTGFISQVEFADGKIWVPSRSALADPRLAAAVAPSAEEERLVGIYKKKGLSGVLEELKKF